MTQHTLIGSRISRAEARRDPWWIPLGEAIASLFGSASRDVAASDLPPEVLRDYDPALHRSITARVAGRDLDTASRPLFY